MVNLLHGFRVEVVYVLFHRQFSKHFCSSQSAPFGAIADRAALLGRLDFRGRYTET